MEISSCPLARHDARRELHSRPLKIRAFIFAAVVSVLAAHLSATDAPDLDFKQWGLLAIQDGGRRKPVDTFAKEALIRIAGRSIRAESCSHTRGRPDAFLALSRTSARCPVAGRWNNPRWSLGKLFPGQIL